MLNKNSSSSNSNSSSLQYKNTILSNGAIVIEVDGIEDTDTSFQVEGMPFLRIVTEPEYWTTPHVKNSKLKQLELQYDQIRNKAVADWEQDEQKLFLEYQAALTDRNREVMEAMEMEKKLG